MLSAYRDDSSSGECVWVGVQLSSSAVLPCVYILDRLKSLCFKLGSSCRFCVFVLFFSFSIVCGVGVGVCVCGGGGGGSKAALAPFPVRII